VKKVRHQRNSNAEGKKFDEGKIRVDLLPSESLFAVAEVWSRLYAAAQRHMMKWNAGETHDEESGKNHLAHACVNLLMLLSYEKSCRELDDRFKS